MSYRKPATILVALLLLSVAAPGAWGSTIDCDGLVIDVATIETKPEETIPSDVYIVVDKKMDIRPGSIFKVFRPKKVAQEPGGEHRLNLYAGRLQVIDVQNEVLIGRMIEFASRQEHPRVRYETVMLGDCLVLEAPAGPAGITPEELGAETVDVSSMEIPPAAETPARRRIIPSKVLFKFDSSGIEQKWAPELEQMAKFIAAQRPARVIVEGHADWTGPEAYNVGLSRRRAQAVVDYLVSKHGLDRKLFEIEAYGESRPEASNTTAEGRQKNRRAVVSVLIKLIPTVEAASADEAAWPLAVEPERLMPETSAIPPIPEQPPAATPQAEAP